MIGEVRFFERAAPFLCSSAQANNSKCVKSPQRINRRPDKVRYETNRPFALRRIALRSHKGDFLENFGHLDYTPFGHGFHRGIGEGKRDQTVLARRLCLAIATHRRDETCDLGGIGLGVAGHKKVV